MCTAFAFRLDSAPERSLHDAPPFVDLKNPAFVSCRPAYSVDGLDGASATDALLPRRFAGSPVLIAANESPLFVLLKMP